MISKRQHGFSRNRSTITNLTTFTNFVANALSDNASVHTIYTDFRKAFDRVNIDILLNKLHRFGTRGKLYEWFRSYLYDRSTRVAFNGHTAHPFTPPSGVPQGSMLGPLLFIIFINDLPVRLKLEHLLFADDVKLYSIINHESDCTELQNDLNSLHHWCIVNDLELNTSKCFVLKFGHAKKQSTFTYKIGQNEFQEVSQMKDLGVMFDRKLKFDIHTENIVSKANKMLGFIMRMAKDFTSTKCITSLYYTHTGLTDTRICGGSLESVPTNAHSQH